MLELAVVIPTLNEVQNIEILLSKLDVALKGIEWEAIFVDDDSRDGTPQLIRQLSLTDRGIRLLHRIGRRGLSSACLEGMMASAAPYVAVMDADLQHDESVLPQMFQAARTGGFDVVVASRNVEGGSMGEFSRHRQWLSDMGRKLSQSVCRCDIQDPMSGFFLVDRKFLDVVVRRASGISFKILVDLLASSERPVKIKEIPYRFRNRIHGASKLDGSNLVEFALLLADKRFGQYIPARFMLFAAMGAIGAVVHAAVLTVLYRFEHIDFVVAQSVAAFLSMTVNFLTNNFVTYSDLRLRGWGLLGGLLTFYLACSVGAVVNVTLAQRAYENGLPWYLAAAIGLVIGSVWNYAMTSILTWQRKKPRS
jgi:dolichol-phosphate mannosyltransferase